MAAAKNAPLTRRQQEIIDCVLELVRQNGLGGLTTKKIAAEVGFSEAALYRHFHNKEALILGMMDRMEQMLVAPIRKIAAASGLSAKQRLEKILQHHMDLIRQYNSLPFLLLAEAAICDTPALVTRMRSILKTYLEILESIISEGVQWLELVDTPNVDCLALLMMGAPAALAIRHRLLPDDELEDCFEKDLIPFFIDSLLQR